MLLCNNLVHLNTEKELKNSFIKQSWTACDALMFSILIQGLNFWTWPTKLISQHSDGMWLLVWRTVDWKKQSIVREIRQDNGSNSSSKSGELN